jgi:hypothetical protein
MAPALAATSPEPGPQTTKGGTVDTKRIAPRALPFTLYRVNPNESMDLVSEHPDFGDGWSAGQRAVHADRDNAYALYAGSHRMARFGYSRVTPRLSAANLDALVML